MDQRQRQRKITRRRFLQTSAAAAAAAGAACPYFVPSHALAQRGVRSGANDRVTIGHIGTGGQGMYHVGLSHQRGDPVTAICDVDTRNSANAARRVGGKPFITQDYRRLLERKDVDAVIIATPDHWHALMTVHACQAGKDVYSEKPTCRTIQECAAMVNAAQRYDRVVQIGTQGRSHYAAYCAATYVRNGQVGAVKHVDVWHERNFRGGMAPDSPPPANLDWDLWLGPARWRPYNRTIHPFNFRWLMDIGAGFIRDRGNHILSCVYWALGADGTGPVSVEATGDTDKRGVWDVPVTMDVKWEFKNPDMTITWSQPGRQRPFPGTQKPIDWGAEIIGDKGSVIIAHGDGGCDTEQKAKEYRPPADGVHLPLSPGEEGNWGDSGPAHKQNWFDCIRSRQRPVMSVEAGTSVIVLPIIANIAFLLGRKLEWDPQKQQFAGDEEANRFLADPQRYPWHF